MLKVIEADRSKRSLYVTWITLRTGHILYCWIMHCWRRVWEWHPRKSETRIWDKREGGLHATLCLTYWSTQVQEVYTTRGRMSTEWVGCLRGKEHMVADSGLIHTILPPDLVMPCLSVHPSVNKQEEDYSSFIPSVLFIWNSAGKMQIWHWERKSEVKKKNCFSWN